jgi:tetratricopeptide (TPR) repeat protein
MRMLILLICLLCCSCIQVQGQDYFARGVEAYKTQDFETAIEHFEKMLLLPANKRGSSLYYNLGNCYFRNSEPGKARYYYEMALQVDSENLDAIHNIELLEKQTLTPELFAANFSGFDITMYRLLQLARPGILFWIGISCFMLINLIIFVRIVAPTAINVTLMWLLIIPLGLLLLASTAVVGGYLLLDQQFKFGVVVGAGEYAFSEPSLRAPGKFPLPEAVKARVKRHSQGWYEIALPDKTTGWIPVEDILLISNDQN